MIDWEEVIKAESTEELKEIKLWLFQENMRLEQERTELEQARNKFLDERVKLRDELDELNRRTVMERKRFPAAGGGSEEVRAGTADTLEGGQRTAEQGARAWGSQLYGSTAFIPGS